MAKKYDYNYTMLRVALKPDEAAFIKNMAEQNSIGQSTCLRMILANYIREHNAQEKR